MLALFTVSCRSSKTVTQQTHNEAVHDTVIETVTLTLHDTIRETTTILVQTNETGDTTRLTTNRDREKIISRDRAAATTENRLSTSETTGKESTITTAPLLPANPLRSIAPSETYHPFKHHLLTFLLGLLLIPTIKLLLHRLKR